MAQIINSTLTSKLRTLSLVSNASPIFLFQTIRNRKKYLTWPNDWLPFKWEKIDPPIGYFPVATGDPEEVTLRNPTKFKKGYEFLETDDTVPDHVKKLFTLGTNRRGDSREYIHDQTIRAVQRTPVDLSSHEARIASYTVKVRTLQERILHQALNDAWSKIRANHAHHKRLKLLNELSRQDMKRYEIVKNYLRIDHTPNLPGVQPLRVERKRTLRNLTQSYCDNLKQERLAEYKVKLRSQQEDFIKERDAAKKEIEHLMDRHKIAEEDITRMVKLRDVMEYKDEYVP